MISVFTDVDMTCLYSTSVPFLSNNIMTLNTKFVFFDYVSKYCEILGIFKGQLSRFNTSPISHLNLHAQ